MKQNIVIKKQTNKNHTSKCSTNNDKVKETVMIYLHRYLQWT